MRAELIDGKAIAAAIRAEVAADVRVLAGARQAALAEFETAGHRAVTSTCFYTARYEQTLAASSQVMLGELDGIQRVHVLRYDVVDTWITTTSYRAGLAEGRRNATAARITATAESKQ